MKRTILLTATIFITTLFLSGTALGMSHEAEESKPVSAEEQHPGLTGQDLEAQQLDEEQVRELKSILQDEGYAVGELDGEMNPETRTAIREFQRSEDLAVTGEPDENTLRALAPSREQQEFFGVSPEFEEK